MHSNAKQNLLYVALSVCAFLFFSFNAQAGPSDIIFTEIIYNPSGTDTKTEWVEIFNSGAADVVLIEGSGNGSWRFNDGSNHTLTLIQGSLTMPPGGYAVLASDSQTFLDSHPGYTGTVIDTVMSLNNTSDTIGLSSDKGESFFNMVTYENTQGADGDGNSLQLLNSAWVAALETPGEAALAEPIIDELENEEEANEPEPSSGAVSTPVADPKNIKITELFPNPEGDENQEFIELWNNNNASISLEGWKIGDASKIKTLPAITLVPGEYYSLYRSATGIALNNGSETIYLYDKDGNLIDTHTYGSTIEGYSLSYDIKQDAFFWSYTKTPSQLNQITSPNDPPIPTITFNNNPIAPRETVRISGLDSTDPDDDALSYFWTIGERFQVSGPSVEYAFNELGPHLVTLKVNDGYYDVIATSVINVIGSIEVVSSRIAQNNSAPTTENTPKQIEPINATSTGQIFITEIFPNPAGADDSEWIELYNPNLLSVILNNWVIDDEDGGSKPYTIKERVIGPESYTVLGKEETKLTLNNTSDEVRLFNAENRLVDSVLYDDVVEAQSYAKSDDNFWRWSEVITPGEPHTATAPEPYGFTALPITNYQQPMLDLVDIDLQNIRELELGTEVRVQGTVAVEPGVLAKTYFYITGSPGIQVYFSKKDWPQLTLGDMIGVIGVLTETNGETRLKVADKQDIVLLYASEPPEAVDAATGDISESMEGMLVKLTGELVKKQGASWMIDDGSGEAKITFQPPTEIQKPAAKAGDWIEVIGLVSETASGYRILPRYQNDMSMIEAPETIDQTTGQVLGAQHTSDQLQRFRVPEQTRGQKILIYLLITSIALIVILAALLIKLKIETQKRLKELERKITN